MTAVLRPYQQTAIREINAARMAGDRPLLVCPTGGGKTEIFLHLATSTDERVMIAVHRNELVEQISSRLGNYPHGIVQSGVRPRPTARVQIASIQTLVNRLDRYAPDVIIFDECFPAGTLIDGRPIESVAVGDLVDSMNVATGMIEKKRVVRLFKNKVPRRLLTFHINNKTAFSCTESHPIFVVGRGWIAAKDVNAGDQLIAHGGTDEDYHMCSVRESIQESAQGFNLRQSVPDYSAQVASGAASGSLYCMRENENGRNAARAALACQGQGVLLSAVPRRVGEKSFIGSNGCNESQVCQCQDESKQSDEQSQRATENGECAEVYRTQATCSGWQRQANAGTTAALVNRLRMAHGSGSGDTWNEMEEPEDRHCQSESYGGYRSRWQQSPRTGKETAGYGEGGGIAFARVDYIEVYEQGSHGEFGRLCPDGYVYNFEVEEHNNYFANGFLVHNCHHAVSRTWGRVIAAYTNAALVGVTATPCRLDGSGLREAGFTILVQGPTTAELMQQGYLTPAQVYGVPLADTSSARVKFGDYVKSDLDRIMSKPSITGDAIRHYRKFADGLPAIGFCISVAKAEETAEAFRAAGYAAASIDGKKTPMERRRLIRALGNGGLQVLTSCDLISEGVDVPVVSCGIILRPTQSLGLYLQQVGRCLRPAPGKTHAVILDHVGNVMRHGMPDSPRVWSLDGTPRRSRATDPDDSPVRICLECYRAHATAPVCPFCGFVYPAKPREIQQVDGDLQLLDWASVPEVPVAKPLEECRSLRDLQAFAKSRGMKPGWAWHRWQGMKGKGAA